MKRGYYVCGYDDDWGVAVVAASRSQAKTLAFKTDYFSRDEWMAVKVRWIRDADISCLPVGIVEPLGEALRRGFFQYIKGICEGCGDESHLEMYKGRALCFNCREEGEVK